MFLGILSEVIASCNKTLQLYRYSFTNQAHIPGSFVFKKVGRRGQTYSQNKKKQIRKSLKSYFKGVGLEGTSILILISQKIFICSPKSWGPTLSKLTLLYVNLRTISTHFDKSVLIKSQIKHILKICF